MHAEKSCTYSKNNGVLKKPSGQLILVSECCSVMSGGLVQLPVFMLKVINVKNEFTTRCVLLCLLLVTPINLSHT